MDKELQTLITELLMHNEIKDEPKILIVGCSTSAILGEPIGTSSNMKVAESVYKSIMEIIHHWKNIFLAVQCCEHLNRALIIEERLRKSLEIQEVNVVPHLRAGGAFATYAFQMMKDACVVEKINAHYGIDIGETFIGMHMQEVVVPLKSSVNYIGEARVKAAYSRKKYIGGERARYGI